MASGVGFQISLQSALPSWRVAGIFAACLTTAWLGTSSFCWGQANQLPWQQLAEQANRQFQANTSDFMPNFMRELTPEELQRLEEVEIDVATEKRFGRRVLDQYETQLRQAQISITRSGQDVARLQRLVAQLKPLMQHANRYRRIRIGVIQDDRIDAYSIPGGELLFTVGLLRTAGSEDAVAGVVAHELSHLDRGHQLFAMKQAKLAQRENDFYGRLEAMGSLIKPFHPEFEKQADADAVQWMQQAGYEPRELARLLRNWDSRQNRVAPWQAFVPDLIRSHPDAGQRAAAVEQLAQSQPAADQPAADQPAEPSVADGDPKRAELENL